MDNGVSVKNVKFIDRSFDKDKNCINLIAVSFMRHTNGYDRVLQGLRDYYAQPDIKTEICIDFVGSGTDLERMINMTKDYGLENNVNFQGHKDGTDLDVLYEKADIAIGSLGDHRVNIYTKSPLKSREYCARGIPFVSSIEDSGFSEDTEYILKVEANDQPLDIERVVKFYEKLCDLQGISHKMREYSINNFDWQVHCKKVFGM
jgi:glycosyltransferase involved in cell wall biosynthesis